MSQEITLLEKALQASPQNWPVRRSLAAHYANHGRAADGARLMIEAPSIPAGEKDQVFAAQLMAETDPAAAHRLLDVFLEENAASAQGHLLKGRLHRAAGESALAESHFNVAAILDETIDIQAEMQTAKEQPVAVVDMEVVEKETSAVALVAAVNEPVAQVTPDVVPVAPAVPLTPRPLTPPPAPVAVEEPAPVVPAAAPLRPVSVEKAPEPVLPAPPLPSPAPISSPAVVAPISSAISGPEVAVPTLVDEFDQEIMEAVYDENGELVHGERALIVGEGELIHAHEKKSDAAEKVSALTMAVVVHVVLAVIFGWFVVSAPLPSPPLLTVANVGQSSGEDMKNQTVTRMSTRSASTVATASPIISAEAFSAVAIPQVTDFSANMALASMSEGDTGLGMSMSGFGDVANMGGIPAAMRSRCSMSERMKRLRESGGEDRAEKAVRNALEFIASKQNKNGSFGKKYYPAMTGLSLLAFLGHCETPESPKFGETVVNAALYLMEMAKKNDGFMWNGEPGNSKSYEHAIATYALCELFTMTKESGKPVPGLENILKKAVDHIVEGQTKGGGWAYGYAQNPAADDMSVAGWQIQALKAAYNTGKRFSGVDKALDNAMKYMKNIQDDKGAFKYRPGDAAGKSSLTGAALLGLQIWNEMDSAEYKKGISYLTNAFKNPAPGSNFYSPYYNTQAFFLHGGKEWEEYNKKFQPKLLDAQNPDGSWTKEGAGGHGAEDAHIMNTAWGCLMLEVYYRYLPTTEKVDGLKPR